MWAMREGFSELYLVIFILSPQASERSGEGNLLG